VSNRCSAASDEPDDFEVVVGFDLRGAPRGFADDFAVALHGDARGIDFEEDQEAVEGGALGHLARLAVYNNFNHR